MGLEVLTAFYVFGCCAILLLVGLWACLRGWRVHSLRRRAHEQISPDSEAARSLALAIGNIANDHVNAAELGTYATITLAEFAWSWANIEPNVIQAADAASTLNIHSGLQFAEYIHSHCTAPAKLDS